MTQRQTKTATARSRMGRTFVLFGVLVAVATGAFFARQRFFDQQTPLAEPVANAPSHPAASPLPTQREGVADIDRPRVDDAAQILQPFEPRLSRMADAFLTDLGIDLQVVTSNDSKDSIEAQADRLFQAREVGKDAPTGGLLILLNPALKLARIEVGYTLEGGLTDLHMGRIARDQLSPYVANGIAGMAVMDVLHYLRDHTYAAAALGNIELDANLKEAPEFRELQKFQSGGAGARASLDKLPADMDFKRVLPAETRARYAPSADAKESVEAFLQATADFAGDPTLPLFTEGSQLMRKQYPFAPFEELKRLERIEASKPIEITVKDDYAVASSRKPAVGFVPILLHKEDGLWRVDLVETWKNLFFDRDGNYYLRNSNTPYAFGLTQFGKGDFYLNLVQLTLEHETLTKELSLLETRRDVLSHLRRGDLWLRNAFVFAPAFAAYEAARAAAPNDPMVQEILAHRALYLGFPEIAIPLYESIGRGVELSIVQAYFDAGDFDGAHRWVSRALQENPYDVWALQWRQYLHERQKTAMDATEAKTLAMLLNDPERKGNPVVLSFPTKYPRFEPQTTIDVGGTTVYDHSHFGVTIQNTSSRPIELDSVTLTSVGTARASGLGDIRKYWQFPSGSNRLNPVEHAYFSKQWGFTVDTGHEHVRYVFRTCWHGVGTSVRQCQTQWVDTLPDSPRLKNEIQTSRSHADTQ